MAHAFDIDELVWLMGHQVVVVARLTRGRYLVRFDNGAELVVPEAELAARAA